MRLKNFVLSKSWRLRGKSIQRSICWDFQLVLGTKFEIIINNGDSEVQLWFSDAYLRLGCQHTDLSEFIFLLKRHKKSKRLPEGF